MTEPIEYAESLIKPIPEDAYDFVLLCSECNTLVTTAEAAYGHASTEHPQAKYNPAKVVRID